MEILNYIVIFIGIFCTGYVLGILLTKVYEHFSKPKPIVLSIDNYDIPAILPLFGKRTIARGIYVDGNKLTMTWEHKHCSTRREITITEAYQAELKYVEELWYKNEVNFYLRNKHVFQGKKK